MTEVVIYTDGACSGNPGPGGWGAVLRWNACVRFLMHHRELAPRAEEVAEPIVSE